MSEASRALAQAKTAGHHAAQAFLDSQGFRDWVADSIFDRRLSESELPTSTAESIRAARAFLKDATYEHLNRQLLYHDMLDMSGCGDWVRSYGIHERDCVKAFSEGFRLVMSGKRAVEWLAEEIRFRVDERLARR